MTQKEPPLKADLHCHTHLSDGQHTPAFVVERARANLVTHLAITDHDVSQAPPQALNEPGLKLINGVEISCLWEAFEIHIVGLFVDPTNSHLQTLLSNQQMKRRERVAQIGWQAHRARHHGSTGRLIGQTCPGFDPKPCR